MKRPAVLVDLSFGTYFMVVGFVMGLLFFLKQSAETEQRMLEEDLLEASEQGGGVVQVFRDARNRWHVTPMERNRDLDPQATVDEFEAFEDCDCVIPIEPATSVAGGLPNGPA